MKKCQIIIISILIAFLNGCKSKEESITLNKSPFYRTDYYGGIPFWESPIKPFLGKKPMNFEDAKQKIHIEAGYDQHNKLVDIKVKQGNQYKDFGGFFGALYIHAPHTKISYQKNKEIHEFYDKFENRINGWGKVFQKVYEKDELGRYKSLYFLNNNGDRIENSWGIYSYNWSYEKDGSIIETRPTKDGTLTQLRGMFQFERIRMIFSPDGHLSLMQNIDKNGKLKPADSGAAQYKYYYDSKGRFLRWEIFDEKGKPAIGPTNTSGEYYVFNEGNSTEIHFFDKEGKPRKHTWGAEFANMVYDKHGNIVRVQLLSPEGKPIIGNNGFATTKFDYDESGFYLTQRSYLNLKGGLTTNTRDGVAQIRYLRDHKGLITEIQNYNSEGNIVNATNDGVAITSFKYDDKGLLVETQKMDTQRKVIK